MALLAKQQHARSLPARPAPRRVRMSRGAPVVKCVAAPMKPQGQGSNGNGTAADDSCRVFVDRDGEMIRVMCCDYGFRAGAGRLYQENYGEVPDNVFVMARDNFQHELAALRRSFRYNEYDAMEAPRNPLAKLAGAAGGVLVKGFASLDSALEGAGLLPELKPAVVPEPVADENGELVQECKEIRAKLRQLKLSDAAVWAHEEERKATKGDVAAPWYIKAPFWALCVVLDLCFANRPIQRFWVLETVARIPYFAYISILHLYESLGFWRAGAELRRIHFAEEWNELHHLQIMESLGGDQLWFDRFVAEHAAIVYYWVLIGMYLLSPKDAYVFSELVEWHATDTYEVFVQANADALAELPPPLVAANYYRNQDLYMFDELQTCSGAETPLRRPACNTLLDVFVNIKDDEIEHVKTMHACQDTKRIAADLASRRQKAIAN